VRNFKIYIKTKIKNIEFLLNINSKIYKFLNIKNCYSPENNKLKCIFIHIPKTAGRSFHKYLFGTDSPGHIPLKRYHILDNKKYIEYYKFCFVRKPSERLYSAFNHYFKKSKIDEKLIRGKEEHFIAKKYFLNFKNFEDFLLYIKNKNKNNLILQLPHFRPMVDWINVYNEIPIDLKIFPAEKIHQIRLFFDKKFNLSNHKFPEIGKDTTSGLLKLNNESILCNEIIQKFYKDDQYIYEKAIRNYNKNYII
tara:strand:- start:12254 stop:13006 length:753 start_codon:yes stop_codon:yes gene_type:complete